MFSCPQRGEIDLPMGLRDREIQHDVDLVIGQQCRHGIDFRHTMLFRLGLGLFWVEIGAGNDPRITRIGRHIGEVRIADRPAPDESDAGGDGRN